MSKEGKDLSEQFIRGTVEVIAITKIFPIKAAILKERSPSGGVHFEGVTTAGLKEQGISVFSEEELTEEIIQHLLGLN